MKKNLNYFNYEERNGIFLLSFLLVLFCLFIFLQKRVLPEQTSITLMHSSIPISVTADFSKQINDVEKKEMRSFETNVLEKEKLRKVSYQKVNAINTSVSKIPEPKEMKFSKVKKTFEKVRSAKVFKKKKRSVKGFSINSKNPEDWKQVYGIGEGYATRIIKYQNWLGGFHSKEQIKEVYGITDSFYNEFEKHLLPSKPYRIININEAEEKELGKHPYMSWKDAKKVVRYRKHHYPLNKEDFKSILGIHDTIKTKMLPYLSFREKKDVVSSPKALANSVSEIDSLKTVVKDSIPTIIRSEK